MHVQTRTLTVIIALLAGVGGGLVPPAAGAADEAYFRPVVPAQPTASPGKIEVIEFFSYGCPHCAHFDPLLSAWAAKLPKDVVLRRVPVGFDRPPWINLQRAYYALESDGDLGKLDAALFHAIHEEQQPLWDEPHLAEWVGRNGGNVEKFSAAYVSFGVNNQTVQADKLQMDYAIDSVPSIAVAGRYVITASTAGGEMPYLKELLVNTDKVIAKVRAEHAPAPRPGSAPAPR